MANKSVISIDVNDSKFKEFAAAFAKYQEALKAMPKDWDKSNAASGKHAADTEKALKKIQKAQKDLNKDIADGLSVLKGVSKVTGDIAANFASSAVSIAKWLTLSAIGSGFGLGALAGSATNTRKSASGIGVTTGELRAANVNYGNILSSPEGSLSKIADAQNDLFSQQILTRLGGKSGQDAAQMLPTLFKNAIQEFKANGQNIQTADVLGLTKLFDMQDLRRGAAASADELNKMAEAFQRDSKLLSINPADEKIMGDFWNQLKRSGEALEVNLIKALAPVSKELTELSAAITKAITDFIGSEKVKQALDDFTKYLSSDDAKKDMADFFSALKSLADALIDLIDYLPTKHNNLEGAKAFRSGNWLEASGKMGAKDFLSANLNMLTGGLLGTDANTLIENSKYGSHKVGEEHSGKIKGLSLDGVNHNVGNMRPAGQSTGFQSFASDEDALRAMATQLRQYQNKYHVNTVNDIISRWAPPSENNTAAYISDVAGRTGFKPDQQLDLNNNDTLAKLIAAITSHEGKKTYDSATVSKVIVTNAAGSDLVVSANATK